MSFSFVQGRVQSAGKLCCIMFPEGHVVCSTHTLGVKIYVGSFRTGLMGRNDGWFFTGQMLTGNGYRLVGQMKAFHKLSVQCSVMFDPLYSAFYKTR
jgi:hypothetical protein